MEEKENSNILKDWRVWVGVILILLVIIFVVNYNGLSRYETMEKFLDLVSQSEYSKAKKYVTNNFTWDLASVKKKNLKNAESFTYKYGDYCLEDGYDIAYININDKELKYMSVYKFKLKKTIFGYKIDDYKIDYEYY